MVQGGPGTGKTAVALHRAAYLLYTHRFPLERQGVLVVGPNPLFLRYIEQVLPSLGRDRASRSRPFRAWCPRSGCGSTEPAEVARLKGDARMAKLMARAVRARERRLRRDPSRCRSGRPCCGSRSRTRPGSSAGPDGGPATTTQSAASSSVRSPRSWSNATSGSWSRPRSGWGRVVDGPLAARGLGRRQRGLTADEEELNRADLAAQFRRTPAGPRGARPDVAAARPSRAAPRPLRRPRPARPPRRGAAERRRAGDAGPAAEPQRSTRWRWTAADAALVDEARAVLGPWRPRADPRPDGGTGPGRAARRGRVLAGRARPLARADRPRRRSRPPTRSARSATSSSTRPRTSRRCSCGCWPGGRCRAR